MLETVIPARVAKSSQIAREASPSRPEPTLPTPSLERSPSAEKTRPSGRLMWHIAQGNFEDGNFDPAKTTDTISERSYQALEIQHDNTRQRDSELRQRNLQKQREEMQREGKSEAEISATLHHVEMSIWAKKEALRLAGFILRSEDKKATVAALNKVGFSISPDNPTTDALRDSLYKLNSTLAQDAYGEFYERFCRRDVDTNKALATELDAAEMDSIKPFLVDILGSETAFNALKALRQTQEMLVSTQRDTSKQSDAYQAEPSLREDEQETFDYFKKGVAMLPSEPQPQPTPEPPQPPKAPESPDVGKEHLPTLSSKGIVATEASPEHPSRNDDTFFFDEQHARGGIFDGAGGYGDGNRASEAARDEIKRVMAEIPENASAEEIKKAMKEAFAAANEKVKEKQKEIKNPSASTTAAVFQIVDLPNSERKLIVANVGDSRIWIQRADGTIKQVSQDGNNLRNLYKAGRIDEAEYKRLSAIVDSATTEDQLKQLGNYYNFVWKNRNQSRLLGSPRYSGDYCEIFEDQLQKGDTIFMTTDGVHDNLTRKEIEDIVRANPDPQQLAEALVAKAREVSGRDRKEYPRAKKDDITVTALSPESTISISPQSATQPSSST